MGGWDGFEEIVAIADTGTFIGAARLLKTSTSHVSRAVAALELRIGAQIFTRSTRAVKATDLGAIMIDRSRRVLQERDQALSLISGNEEPQGELRLTCSTALGERFVAPIVRRFAEDYPALAIKMDLTNRVVDLVGEGVDLGIRTGGLTDGRLLATQVASRRMLLCASPDYLFRRGSPRTPDELERHECLVSTSSSWHFQQSGQVRLFNPRGRWHCNNGEATVQAALAGMGICQLPEFYVAQALASGTLQILLDEFRPEDQPVWAVYSRRRQLHPNVRRLVERLTAELTPAMSQGIGTGHISRARGVKRSRQRA